MSYEVDCSVCGHDWRNHFSWAFWGSSMPYEQLWMSGTENHVTPFDEGCRYMLSPAIGDHNAWPMEVHAEVRCNCVAYLMGDDGQ